MRYADIKKMDISNGEGIGVSLFVQGCHFHCKNCFNSSTWDFDSGKEWTEETKNIFLDLIDKPHIKRVSILGGEPLADENIEEIYKLLIQIRDYFPDKKIWLYTGYDFDTEINDLNFNNAFRLVTISLCDVLIDGRFVDELKDFSLKWKGSSNQKVIDVQKSLKNKKIELYYN